MLTKEYFNELGSTGLPGHIGIVITKVETAELHAELTVGAIHMAGNGFLHAGTVVSLADTSAGYGCVSNLPHGAIGFTTVELKSNHLGTARSGKIACVAKATHMGKTTHVWDAIVTHVETGKVIAVFRCTQMILYAK
jgi:1,4-dihydroxy-2-naphthoyl-CoA hydrolase